MEGCGKADGLTTNLCLAADNFAMNTSGIDVGTSSLILIDLNAHAYIDSSESCDLYLTVSLVVLTES